VARGAKADAALSAHGVDARLQDGALRRIEFGGCEVVRLIDYPIRDADWGTLPTVTTYEQILGGGRGFRREFRTADGGIAGSFQADLSDDAAGVRLVVELDLSASREVVVNRAGFVVLHPLKGVVGEELRVGRPDGSDRYVRFPELISPSQPVKDILSLSNRVGGVDVSIAFEGDVFEMEDQRNWTDASFKTYCRPLALPRPYRLAAGETVRQRIVVTLTRTGKPERAVAGEPGSGAAIMPDVCLAQEAALGCAPHPDLASIGPQGLLLRVGPSDFHLSATDGLPPCPVTLELVTGSDPAADIRNAAAAMSGAGLSPVRVVALPQGYLQSHQPEGPWPEGATPMDLVPHVRAAFPSAQVGGGMLTNFTEFNRCPPDPAVIDFATFGTTAIVHAADDTSVLETLEAVPHVIASARGVSGDRPLRLGLMSIGMRSNPYGAGVLPNPEGRRLPMAMDDPRQRTAFTAAFAVALAAACARGGVASFAPAMAGGPLGMADAEGCWPLWHAVAALAALAGTTVTIEGGPAAGLVVIRGQGRRGVAGIAANLGPGPVALEDPAVLVPDRAAPDWIDRTGPGAALTLAPMTTAILKGDGA